MGNKSKDPLYNIISAAAEGLSKGDLSGLNSAVEDSVNSVLNSVETKLHDIGDIETDGRAINLSTYKAVFSSGQETAKRQQKLQEEKEERLKELERANALKAKNAAEKKNKTANALVLPVPFSPVGKISSVVRMVFGGCGMAVAAIGFIKNIFLNLIGVGSISALIFSFAFLAVFGIVLNSGIVTQRRLTKATRFAQLTGNRKYIPVEELSKSVNQSRKKTLRDIKKMLAAGYFPEGHIDEEKTTLMLSDSVYSEYKRSIEDRQNNLKEPVDATSREVSEDTKESSELDDMISEGNSYIETLHKLNDEIPGEIITAKLNRLEKLLKEIFACLEKHPDQMPRMHEVMSYYLPTVVKLVEAYREYDSVTEAGDEIKDAKSQIEGSIDTINEALKKLLNNLFRDSVWDVTTDASVLNTMLAQNGLVSGNNTKENNVDE